MTRTARTAADPGRPVVTRRGAFAACAVAGLAAGAPLARSASAAETPVMRMFTQWLTASIEFARLPSWFSDEQSEPHFLRTSEPADEIVDLPSTGPEDWLLKFAAHTSCGEHDLFGCPGGPALLAELEQLIRSMSPTCASLLAERRRLGA